MRVPARIGATALSTVVAGAGLGLLTSPTAAPAEPEKPGSVRVIATFEASGATGRRPHVASIRAARADVLADLPRNGYDVVSTYSRIPAVSLEVDAEALAALEADPQVLAVQEDRVVETAMAQANELTGVNDVHNTGITGDGITAAIIDSGVDSDHSELADDLVGQACFRSEGDCSGDPGSAEDHTGHGTHVAGIITGPEGVAPDAQFYALKVFTTGTTSDTNVLNALNYVIDRNTTEPGSIDLVNMSIAGARFADAGSCNTANAAYRTAFATLNSQGVTVFASTGNDSTTSGVSSPACVDGAVGVGSTGDATFTVALPACTDQGEADRVSCYSNATPLQGDGELVDLLAPGCRIRSLGLNNASGVQKCGTSMATAFAAGSAALVLEYAGTHGDSLTPASLETLLESTGVSVSDYRITDSPSYPRVAPDAAIASLSVPTPLNVQVTGTTSSSVSLSWTGSDAADHYQLVRTTELTGDTTTIVISGTDTSDTDSSAPCGDLSYEVQAVDGAGNVSQSSSAVIALARSCPVSLTGITLTPVDVDTHLVGWAPGAEPYVVLQRRLPGAAFADEQLLLNAAGQYEDTVSGCGRVEYRVFALASNGDRSAPSTVVARSMCAPANDNLADAEVLSVGPDGTTVSEVEASARYGTQEAADPAFSCHHGGAAHGYDGVWYRIDPATEARVTISTAGTTLVDPATSAADTLVAVYRGSPSLTNEVGCNDDISGSVFRSSVTSNLEPGVTYLVHVAQYTDVPDHAAGDLVTGFTWAAPASTPANDTWSSRAPITTSPYSLSVTNAQTASTSGSDPLHACAHVGPRMGTHTLWWSFTPIADGTLDLDTLASTGSFTDTVLSVYTGEPGSFVDVACNDDTSAGGGNQRSELDDVALDAGTEYSVLASRWSTNATSTPGTVVLKAAYQGSAPPEPPKGRPDARISGSGPLVGDGVYGGTAQTKSGKAKAGKAVTHVVSLQNDATTADSLRLRGTGSAKGFKVKYRAPSGADITTAVAAGTYQTPSLAAGNTYNVRVVVKVGNNAKKQKPLKGALSVASRTTPSATDVVFLVTKRRWEPR